jgi:acyl carrier protein
MQIDATSIVADALGVSPQTVTPSTSLMSTVEWDSLAHFRIVLAVEEALKRSLNPLEITTLIDLASVKTLLDKG